MKTKAKFFSQTFFATCYKGVKKWYIGGTLKIAYDLKIQLFKITIETVPSIASSVNL
jgi:hypothetical protein